MSDVTKRIAGLSPEKRALLERRLAAGTRPVAAARPGIAVIGMSCRLPGADSPEAFWELMFEKRDAITEVPAHRWDARALFDADVAAPGKMATRWGGFLPDIDGFDAEFFGIPTPEADRMDPQQRLLMEVTWEALQAAGYPVDSLAGRRVGVFIGIHSMSSEYYWRQAANLHAINAYTSTGAAHSIAANRLSYLLDLRGPSLAVDAACSSSLVALHLACQSLRTRESEMAVVGGVNLLLAPEASVAFSKLGLMAADGRCKTFDASADGFVRSEGCGVVILRRLEEALEHGDPVMAIIRGSAVNQDGATNGLTSPSGLSQREVVRQALRDGDVAPERITLVETHGTGTSLGDSIEVEALVEVLGQADGGAVPCTLGAAKTNIGHLEAAAGIAGVIKTVLCLQHRYIPANLHFRSLNPHISIDGTRLRLPGDGGPWLPGSAEARLAAVASFGFGGTNAHVVLEESPPSDPGQAGDVADGQEWLPLPVSARTAAALRANARRWLQWLTDPDQARLDPRAVSYTAAVRRDHYACRRLVVGRSVAEWAGALHRIATGESGQRNESRLQPWPGAVFVYPDQGTVPPVLAGELYAARPIFREAIDRCAVEFRKHSEWPLVEELTRPEAAARLRHTHMAQPALFALQYALTELWRDWGISAEAVIGLGAGEVAAAWAAGILRFEDAARLSLHRGRLMHEAGLTAARAELGTAGGSRADSPFERELAGLLGDLRPAPPRLAIASTVTARLSQPGEHDAGYWARNMREPTRFPDAVRTLTTAGHRVFLELSPHPTALSPLADLPGLIACATLRNDVEPSRTMLEALAVVYELGAPIDFRRIQPAARVVGLPPYAWQRMTHRFGAAGEQPAPEDRGPCPADQEHQTPVREQASPYEIGGRV